MNQNYNNNINNNFNNNNYPSFDNINNNYSYPPNQQYNQNNNNNSNNIANNMTMNILNKASDDMKKGFLDRFKCNLSFLQSYFDIETAEVKDRLIFSLIPFNSKFISLVEKNPDLYGPFWIYTTLIFVIAATGSLIKYLNGIKTEDFFQEFTPIAASVIYGVGFCLPFVVWILMKFFGSETPFMLIVCTYGYSFTIYIPIMILCVPFEKLQWILLAYAVLSSTVFLVLNFQSELNKYIENRKYFVLAIIIIFQICLFIVLKVKFFANIKKKITE